MTYLFKTKHQGNLQILEELHASWQAQHSVVQLEHMRLVIPATEEHGQFWAVYTRKVGDNEWDLAEARSSRKLSTTVVENVYKKFPTLLAPPSRAETAQALSTPDALASVDAEDDATDQAEVQTLQDEVRARAVLRRHTTSVLIVLELPLYCR